VDRSRAAAPPDVGADLAADAEQAAAVAAVGRPRVDIRTTRGLGTVIPAARGQRVLLVGDGLDVLAEALSRTGIEVVDGGGGTSGDVGPRLPVSDAAVDHAVIVTRRADRLAPAVGDLARVLRPGGHAVVVAPNRWRRVRDRRATTPAAVERRLTAAGLQPIGRYGVRQSLQDVRHLVPLGGPAARWYLRHAHLPHRRRGAVFASLVALPGLGWTVPGMFPAIAVIARLSGDATA
jgi:SAM-dependent methyltransferase